MHQAFTIYFFKDKERTNNEIVETDNTEYQTGLPGLKSHMPRDEQITLRERIENDLIAFGEFQANDIVQNSISYDDFVDVQPGNIGHETSKSPNKGIKKPTKSGSFGSSGRTPGSQAFFEESGEDFPIDMQDGFRLSLFNRDKQQ